MIWLTGFFSRHSGSRYRPQTPRCTGWYYRVGQVDNRRDRCCWISFRCCQGSLIFFRFCFCDFILRACSNAKSWSQHIDRSFISDFVQQVRAGTDMPKMFAVGEFWKDSIQDLESYLDGLGTQVCVFVSFCSIIFWCWDVLSLLLVQCFRCTATLQLQRSRRTRPRLRHASNLGRYRRPEETHRCCHPGW